MDSGFDIIEAETRRCAKLIEEQMERELIRSMPPDWPRYLSPFPAGTVPKGFTPIKNRLSSKHRKQVRQMKAAMRLLRKLYKKQIEEDFNRKWMYKSIRVSIFCA